jgi:tetratricopeptide (TPR) repeat protein
VLRAKILEAACLLYLSRPVEALAATEEVISRARGEGDRKILVYGLKNAAEMLVELRDLARAETYYSEALALFDELGIVVESARSEWLLARVAGMRGALQSSTEGLAASRAKLFELGLLDDHALATLDWSEFRLALDEPAGVAEACRQIILRYESESMTRNARLALAHLQEALRKENATPSLVREIRDYLALLPRYPHRPFAPSASAHSSQEKH